MKETAKPKLSKDKRLHLLNLLAVKHSHSEMYQWAGCKECQDKFQKYKLEKSKLSEIELGELQQDILKKVNQIDPKILETILAQKRAGGVLPEIA